jgi:hypothetical protein
MRRTLLTYAEGREEILDGHDSFRLRFTCGRVTDMKPILFSLLLCAGTVAACADEVTDWNQTMLQAVFVAGTNPPTTTRVTAIVQAAVFDAINGIERRYTAIYLPPIGPSSASKGSAVVQAAYATLMKLYPDQAATFDKQRAASMAAITDSSDAIQQGVTWGQTVADAIWTWRSSDGFSDAPPPYLGGTQPGQWRPTPPAMTPGLVPQLANVTPWVIRSPSEYRTPGPPAMTSDQYTADYNETKTMGGASSASRTADQTLFSNFWQSTTPADFWDPVVTSLAAERHLSMLKTARLLALVNLGIADAGIGCWDGKYTYSFWRPITAIQNGDTDGNSATAPDPGWTPLITTPPFPEYPSAHSCVSGAAGRILSDYFGEETAFSVVSRGMPGVTRKFQSFTAAFEEVKNARIFGGIHFRTACVDGQSLGVSVANYILGHAMLPLSGGR